MSIMDREEEVVGGQLLSSQRAAAREEELRIIREEHERLGRQVFWLGETIAAHVEEMDVGQIHSLFCKATNDGNAYRYVVWWKKVFIWLGRLFSALRRRQEARLLLYAGAKRYISSGLEAAEVDEGCQDMFLPLLLKQQVYGARWRSRFINDDRLRSQYKRQCEAEARAVKGAQELKQLVELQKRLADSMLERLKKGYAWLEIGRFNQAAESQLTIEVLSSVVRLGAKVGRLGIAALFLAAYCKRVVDTGIRNFEGLHGEIGGKAGRLKQEILQLAAEVRAVATEVSSQGRSLKDDGLTLAQSVRQLTKARAEESTRRAEAATRRADAARQRNRESKVSLAPTAINHRG